MHADSNSTDIDAIIHLIEKKNTDTNDLISLVLYFIVYKFFLNLRPQMCNESNYFTNTNNKTVHNIPRNR